MFFRSERLFLRPAWPEDWTDLAHAAQQGETARNPGAAPWPFAPEDVQAYAALPQQPRYPRLIITLPTAQAAAERTIGTVGFQRGVNGRTELGCWIARHCCGQGFATEAVRGALSLARTLGHERVYAAHCRDNPAGARLLRKAGFVPTGRVEQQFSRARGEMVPVDLHAIRLDAPDDCDGCGARFKQAA